jgi:hypothetical protein
VRDAQWLESRTVDFFKFTIDFLKQYGYIGFVRHIQEVTSMTNEWHELTDLTGERPFTVTSVRLPNGISLEGEFELPPLARLRYEDQVFVAEFVRSHGSIKDMERAFGISYPTVKNRLNRIVSQLRLVVDVERGGPQKPAGATTAPAASATPTDAEDVLGALERGEITAVQAAERLRR